MKHKFVELIPKPQDIVEGCLYISLKYDMTSHQCACGCGQVVPLPLSPQDWTLEYDGESVSMTPSIGNGQLECGSHYLIRKNGVVWLSTMNRAESSKLLNNGVLARENNSIASKLVKWVKKLIFN